MQNRKICCEAYVKVYNLIVKQNQHSNENFKIIS